MNIKLPEGWYEDSYGGLYEGPRGAYVIRNDAGWWSALGVGKPGVFGPHPTAALAFRALGIEVEEESE